MKFSIAWLREWVDPAVNTEELSHQLTMAGLEVDEVAPVAAHFTQVKVGKIVAIEQHPSADRLRVCQVDVGLGNSLQIVCGAANARLDLKTAAALDGAELPNGLKIKPTKLRGVESLGMLCSETELGLASSASGIMELPDDAPVGKELSYYLQLDDQTLDIDLTPNRGDCLSIKGIAREVAALNSAKLMPIKIKPIKPTTKVNFKVELQARMDCPHYIGRVINNINPNAITPMWMRERLRRSGINCIHPVVDITNYVMLELGQPLHGFDLEKLSGAIHIRYAKAGETLKLLDQQMITLDDSILVIADEVQPQALAGVMGGTESAISSHTQHVFLESAFFEPLIVINSEKKFNLFSESSRRYTRGVDPTLQQEAIERATALILQIAGGEAGPLVEKKGKGIATTRIQLRCDRIKRVLGFAISDRQIEKILTSLGMEFTSTILGWEVEVPSHRFDIKLEIDLIEELARLYGYDNISSHLPYATLTVPQDSETKLNIHKLKKTLIDLGYHEAITYSFINADMQQLIDPGIQAMQLLNPISADMSTMRTSLWPGLLNVVDYNQNRQLNRIRVFEVGMCYREEGKQLNQVQRLAGVMTGDLYPEQWGIKQQTMDFFDVKKDVEFLLGLGFAVDNFKFVSKSHSALHPSQSAAIQYEDEIIGYVGAMHPQLLKKLKFDCQVYLFELELDKITSGKLPRANIISKFPSMRRDIAFVIDKKINYKDIYNKIEKNTKDILKTIKLFDVYQGENLGENKKSIAVGLIFQHFTRTLTDTEVNDQVNKIVQVLTKDFGIKLRE